MKLLSEQFFVRLQGYGQSETPEGLVIKGIAPKVPMIIATLP